MVSHDWMIRVFEWMGISGIILSVLKKFMSGWKTRLEVNNDGTVQISRWTNTLKYFMQGDSYSSVSTFLEEMYKYRMGLPGERMVK